MTFEAFIKHVVDTTIDDLIGQMPGIAQWIDMRYFREGTFVDFKTTVCKDDPKCLGYFRESIDGFGITIVLPVLEGIIEDDARWMANSDWTEHSKFMRLCRGYDARFTAKVIETIYHEFKHGVDAVMVSAQGSDYITEYLKEEKKVGYWNNRFEVAAREQQKLFERTAKKFFSYDGKLVDYKNM